MNFTDLNIRDVYDSEEFDDIGREFIEKVLVHSVSYDRAVGFFSSSCLMHISRGIINVASRHIPDTPPNIRFIVSCELSKEDVEAVEKGIKTRDEIIEKNMLSAFDDAKTYYESERLNMLCHLIASGAMEIKVAITQMGNGIGMFHEKIGVMKDSQDNYLAFEGSLNETGNAYVYNYESVYTKRSWDTSSSTCTYIRNHFEKLWTNNSKKARIYDFPTAVKERLFKYKKSTFDKDIDRHEDEHRELEQLDQTIPRIDKELTPTFPYDYQEEAIKNFIKQRGVGIFDMATGTGKTYTGYGAMVSLLKVTKYHLATIIIAPYKHLVDQWVDDACNFHINGMIVGYSGKNYISQLENAVLDFNSHVREYFYFICTYATYKTQKVQSVLKQIKGPVLFVADEAHNCGSSGMADCLLPQFRFRLALSATVERYRDEEGTQRIFDYFGKKCINYPLERAIKEGKLTEYKYHPEIVYLNEEERTQYIKLTKDLIKSMTSDRNGRLVMTKQSERIAIKRARVIAGAQAKVAKLRELLQNYKDEKNILVYCGTSKSGKGTDEEIRQISEVTKMMGLELKMDVHEYTSEENVNERQAIKERFVNGELQALVAIKCLDEGVNIPSIKTAFILASSTNPREYIQRRGRVLRLAKGKIFAEIYDFICLPDKFENLMSYDQDELKMFKSLISNETNRMKEFGAFALNPDESLLLVNEIIEEYGFDKFEADDLPEFEWLEETE